VSAEPVIPPFVAGCGADCPCQLPHHDPRQNRVHVFSTGAWTTREQRADGSYVHVYLGAQEGA
jgi:hypothetical protein